MVCDDSIFSYRYLYNGKELADYTLGTAYLGTLDYGARHYDPRIARWTVPDPMAENYYGVNAYGYCLNNPIRYSDPTGQKPKDVIMGGIIGLITNVLPVSGKLRDSYIPADKDDYNYGLQVADITSGVVGVIMIVSGEGGQAAGGGLVAVGAGVAATGIGAPEGGIVALGGTVAVAGGVVLEAGGMYILANSAENASGGYERGKSYSEKQKINHPAARKQKSINQMQKDIDSGRAPKGIKRFDKGHTKGGQPL